MKIIFTLLVLFFVANAEASGSRDSLPAGKTTREIPSGKRTASTTSRGYVCRVIGSMTPCEPLLVIDGLPYDYDELKTLNPSDIESITILKDAEALGIYGSRGACGVIGITTKKTSHRKFVIRDFLTKEVISNATVCFTSGKVSFNIIANDSGRITTSKLKSHNKYSITVSSAGYKTFTGHALGSSQEIFLERDVRTCEEVIVSYSVHSCTHRTTTCTLNRVSDCQITIIGSDSSSFNASAFVSKSNFSHALIYPNPVQRSNAFNLEWENEQDVVCNIAVIGMNGSIVLLQSKKIMKGLNRLSIIADTKWAAGIYNIQLRNEKGTLVRQEKLIVQ